MKNASDSPIDSGFKLNWTLLFVSATSKEILKLLKQGYKPNEDTLNCALFVGASTLVLGALSEAGATANTDTPYFIVPDTNSTRKAFLNTADIDEVTFDQQQCNQLGQRLKNKYGTMDDSENLTSTMVMPGALVVHLLGTGRYNSDEIELLRKEWMRIEWFMCTFSAKLRLQWRVASLALDWASITKILKDAMESSGEEEMLEAMEMMINVLPRANTTTPILHFATSVPQRSEAMPPEDMPDQLVTQIYVALNHDTQKIARLYKAWQSVDDLMKKKQFSYCEEWHRLVSESDLAAIHNFLNNAVLCTRPGRMHNAISNLLQGLEVVNHITEVAEDFKPPRVSKENPKASNQDDDGSDAEDQPREVTLKRDAFFAGSQPLTNSALRKSNSSDDSFHLNTAILCRTSEDETILDLLATSTPNRDTLNCALYANRSDDLIQTLLHVGALPNDDTAYFIKPSTSQTLVDLLALYEVKRAQDLNANLLADLGCTLLQKYSANPSEQVQPTTACSSSPSLI